MAYGLLGQQHFEAGHFLSGLGGVGLGRIDVRSGLGNLFRAASVAEPCDDLALGRGLGLGLGDLRLQATRVQSGQHLPLAHAVAFLDQHGGYSLAVIERQLYLAEVHIAVQHQLALGVVASAQRPPGPAGGRARRTEQQHDQCQFVHGPVRRGA